MKIKVREKITASEKSQNSGTVQLPLFAAEGC